MNALLKHKTELNYQPTQAAETADIFNAGHAGRQKITIVTCRAQSGFKCGNTGRLFRKTLN